MNKVRELEKTPQMKAHILYHSLCPNCLTDTKELHKWLKDTGTGVQWGWVNRSTLVRSTLTPLEVWKVCKNPQLTAPNLVFHQHIFLEATTEVINKRTTPQTCRQLWDTKHEATEAQQLLCSLHRLLWTRSMRREALPYFKETLLGLNWFSESLPIPHRPSLSLVWQVKKMLNKTQYEQIFSHLYYPTGDRLKKK